MHETPQVTDSCKPRPSVHTFLALAASNNHRYKTLFFFCFLSSLELLQYKKKRQTHLLLGTSTNLGLLDTTDFLAPVLKLTTGLAGGLDLSLEASLRERKREWR